MKKKLVIECPKCRAVLDGHTGLTHDRQPKKGDLSVCLYCTTMLRYSEIENQLTLEILTTAEFSDLPIEKQNSLNSVVKAIADHRAKEKGGSDVQP